MNRSITMFVVLYLMAVRGVDPVYIGVLFAVQNVTALLTYLPIGRMTAVVGLQPFIGLTFVFFALFPLTLALVPDGWGLVLAFVVYGLREIGEPARKALITCTLSYAIWTALYRLRLVRTPMSIRENNCMQSTAGSAGYSTGSTVVSPCLSESRD